MRTVLEILRANYRWGVVMLFMFGGAAGWFTLGRQNEETAAKKPVKHRAPKPHEEAPPVRRTQEPEKQPKEQEIRPQRDHEAPAVRLTQEPVKEPKEPVIRPQRDQEPDSTTRGRPPRNRSQPVVKKLHFTAG
jgi:hypothetical protein